MTQVGSKSNDKCPIRDREDAATGPVTWRPPGAGLPPGAWGRGRGVGAAHTGVRCPAPSSAVLGLCGSSGTGLEEYCGLGFMRQAAAGPGRTRAGGDRA